MKSHTLRIAYCRLLMLPALVLVLCLTPSFGVAEKIWPQWRGPSRDGHVKAAPWPSSLQAPHFQARWSIPLGPGYSGPVLNETTVFVTETHQKQSERVHALNRATGETFWMTEWEGAMSVPFFARANGDWIRSTPALDEDRLYVAGMRDVLVCLSADTGAEYWRRNFVKDLETPLPEFGFVSSPLVAGDMVYVQAGASVCALDKRTGQLKWRALEDEGGMWGSAFSSPILADLNGRSHLIVQTRQELCGLAPETGHVLWRQPIKAFRGMNILTPVVYQDLLFTSTYGGKSEGWRLVQAGENGTLELSWTHKSQGYMSTPVRVGRHVYHHLKNQRIMCLDLETGEEAWMTSESYGKYWSWVANEAQLLALDERGWLYLLKANPARLEMIDSRRVSESECWAHVAVTGTDVVIRALDGVTLYHWE